ncbi:MAG: MBL fold metallo-hydrolase, partial [Allosphingosinicella sp.]
MRRLALAMAAVLASCAAPRAEGGAGAPWHLVPGSFEPGGQPDGNSVFLDAPGGLILVDTGRHPAHTQKLLAYARQRGRPIAAIVNTHWHLDHTSGNGAVRAAFPQAEVLAGTAVRGALAGFLARSREQAQARLDAGEVPEAREAEVRRFLALMADPRPLLPTRPVTASGETVLAGRPLQVNLAPHAATEGDVWLYDPASRTLVAGD